MDSALAKLCSWVENQTRQFGVAGIDENGGLLFEPRTLWDVGRLDVAHPQASLQFEPGMVQLDKEKFRNGARWPIVITRLSLAAINYLLASNDNDLAADATSYRNATSVLSSAKFLLSVPRRQFYSKRPVIVTAASMRPTAEPLIVPDQTDEPLASGIFGISRLEFDKKLRLPRNAAVELYLGSYTVPATGQTQPAAEAHISVEERGGIAEGACRFAQFNVKALNSTGVPIFQPDAFGSGGQGSAIPFPSDQAFMRDPFVKQKPSRGTTSADFGAINVHLNQIDYDDALIANLPLVVTTPLTPLSLRIPTKCRTVGGGTGTDWWIPGCPLALAFTEITPALVYDLPEPITLNPGDTLDIQLLLPLQTTGVDPTISPVYQIGVGASGFAVIEG